MDNTQTSPFKKTNTFVSPHLFSYTGFNHQSNEGMDGLLCLPFYIFTHQGALIYSNFSNGKPVGTSIPIGNMKRKKCSPHP